MILWDVFEFKCYWLLAFWILDKHSDFYIHEAVSYLSVEDLAFIDIGEYSSINGRITLC